MDYVSRAYDAELRGDYQRAGMWWYYAAEALSGNPHGLRTSYQEKQDRALAIARLGMANASPE